MACLARWSPLAVLAFDPPYTPVFGCGPHFPLRMIKAHMTGLASAGVPGLGLAESVPGMAGVALGIPVAELFRLSIALSAYFVTPRTTFVPVSHNGGRLMVPHRHGATGNPCELVFAFLELLHLVRMARSALSK